MLVSAEPVFAPALKRASAWLSATQLPCDSRRKYQDDRAPRSSLCRSSLYQDTATASVLPLHTSFTYLDLSRLTNPVARPYVDSRPNHTGAQIPSGVSLIVSSASRALDRAAISRSLMTRP